MPDTGLAPCPQDLTTHDVAADAAGLARENAKLRKINASLILAIERGAQFSGSGFALFQTAAALGNQVQERTAALTTALRELERVNAALKAAKDEEGQARAYLVAAIEAINQGIILCDAEDRVVIANRRYREVWGDLPAEPGTPFEQVVAAAAQKIVLPAGQCPEGWEAFRLARHRNPGEPFVVEFSQGVWLQISERRMADGGTVSLYTDITGVKREEERRREREVVEALREANESLERRVADRTAELLQANIDMMAAKAEAEQVNLAKTKFFAAANHDLLQPLAAARVFASALSERRLSPPNRELVRHALSALDSVDDLLTALLDVAKLDAGVIPAAHCSFALADVLRPMAEEYGMIAARRRLRLRVFAGDVVVRTDPKLLSRILRNLVSNALRYSARGGVLIGHRSHPDGILVGVWDTGIGIARDQQEEIFEEFRRLPPGTDCTERGAGLGLSIVQRISRMLGHKLVVRSVPGRGSLFGIVLPASHEPPVCLRRPASLPGQTGGPGALRGRIVQLIDDEPHVLQGLGVLLGGWGVKVCGARSAAEALHSPDAAAPDLIIADYHLGGTTGLDAIATLRRRWGDVPAIVATADYSQEVASLVQAAGHHLMHKPVRPARLRSLITHVLTAVPFEA
jgi:signal transduction histidine kinase/CheY-like chemotaxis protein